MDYGRLLNSFRQREQVIKQRLEDFKQVYNWPETKLFCELAFCLLTPQSRARSCDSAVQDLEKKELLQKGTPKKIAKILKLKGVRFYNNKAKYIIEARGQFFNGSNSLRNSLEGWRAQTNSSIDFRNLVSKNIKGLGLKEASHFLRNIGHGEELAILDRHILKNLVKYRVIREIPKSLTAKRYHEIEQKLFKFANKIGISGAELDLLLWSEETGEIFK
ncbi:TPA: N-glycosylase/DNA lyase [archaeon]|uniref:8-oxoguanine DNA glycosylase/AP lyase n=1 Tax=Candidatus Naiadarchaeum limnaeum TaxID=2756139 RepID=A0A832UQQ2_9ARCH|nr:N-glycosylase/DNA lyase [Candidatus Naiadarchaeum limnaeum]